MCVYTVLSSVRFCDSDVVNVDCQASPQYSVVERTVLRLGCVEKGCGKRVTKRWCSSVASPSTGLNTVRLDTCKSVTMRLDTCKSVNQMFDKMSVCATTSHATRHMPRGVNRVLNKIVKRWWWRDRQSRNKSHAPRCEQDWRNMVVARPRHMLRGLGFRV